MLQELQHGPPGGIREVLQGRSNGLPAAAGVEARQSIILCGGVSSSAAAIARFSLDTEVVHSAAALLANLTRDRGIARQLADPSLPITSAGGAVLGTPPPMPSVTSLAASAVDVMQTHATHAGVQESAMLALDYIARAHEANKASVLAAGAVEAILRHSASAIARQRGERVYKSSVLDFQA